MSRRFALSYFVAFVTFLICAASPCFAGTWNPQNDPENFGRLDERTFSLLPAQGKVAHIPWTGYAWKSRLGGLGQRWQQGASVWSYPVPSTFAQVAGLSPSDRASLSPAEKFDFWSGAAGFPLTQDERRRNDPGAVSWGGMCHGWASAATIFQEPGAVSVNAPDGTEISFGSADVKALLSFVTGELVTAPRRFVGERCLSGAADASPACSDVHPAAFHLLLANRVGLRKESFVVELSEDEEIWNKPIVSYTSSVRATRSAQADSAPGTTQEKVIDTSVTFVHGSDPAWDPQGDAVPLRTFEYSYVLELDASGRVVGGRWNSGHPDFVWRIDADAQTLFAPLVGGRFARLEELYLRSIGQWPKAPPAPVSLAIACPAGFEARLFPVAADGDAPSSVSAARDGAQFAVCVKGDVAFAVSTPAMLDACRISGRTGCEKRAWPLADFLSARGAGVCPRGSAIDGLTRVCADEETAFGPFSESVFSKCTLALGAACETLRLPLAELARVLR